MHRLIIISLLLSACATSNIQRPQKAFIARDVLTPWQIEKVRATNAYDAVERLRSNWLRLRGTTQIPASPGTPVIRENQVLVYLDSQKLGGVDQLRTIEIGAVEYIRFYPPAEASARWGFNHSGGVIFISTMPRDQ